VSAPPLIQQAPIQPTVTPTVAAALIAQPTLTPVAAAPAVKPAPPPAAKEYRPEIIAAVPDAEDISLGVEEMSTNALLAVGFILYLLFESSIFNATIKENSNEIHATGQRFLGKFQGSLTMVSGKFGTESFLTALVRPLAVLGLSALVYSFLNPSFGLNRETAVLFISLMIAVGVSIYTYEGLQVYVSERRFHLDSIIQFFPAAIVFAVLTVTISRISDLNPGLVLGFVAGAVVLGPREPDEDEAGMIVYFPMLALLVVSLVAWAMIGPTRSLAEDGGFLGAALEAAFVLLFASGIQGLLFNLLPITFLDGQKLWRWNPFAWLSIAIPSAFIFFHVIVNRSGTFASASGERSVQMLIIVCVVFWLLTMATWVFFKVRKAREARVEVEV
jgi:hypothetical protein